MKILLAEDEEMMLKAIEFRFQKDGFEVITAKNGKEALEHIKKDPPDLIVTDIMMPFVTGLEIINTVKNELKLDIPIIVLSAVGLEDTVLEAFELGADDFITKPFSPNELIIRIKRLMARR